MASIGAFLQGLASPNVSSLKSNGNLLADYGLKCKRIRASGRNGKSILSVKAIAAPEKPASDTAPFTAWDTAIERVAKRTDLKTIMILGAGPIVIGQV